MVNWYRAPVPHTRLPDRREVPVPTLVVWGEDDPALVPDLARRGLDRCARGRLATYSGKNQVMTQGARGTRRRFKGRPTRT